MFQDHLQIFDVEGWGGKCDNPSTESKANGLHQCRFRKQMVKTQWAPDGFYGRFLTETAICGHVVQSEMGWHTGGDEDNFPILDAEWRIDGEAEPGAYTFLEEADAPFSVEAAQRVAHAGAALVT